MADRTYSNRIFTAVVVPMLALTQVSSAMAQGSDTITNGEERRIQFSTLQPSEVERGQTGSSQSGVKYGSIHMRGTEYVFSAKRGDVVSLAAANISHRADNAALVEVTVLKGDSQVCLGRQVVAVEFTKVLYDCSIPADSTYTMRVRLNESVTIKMSSVFEKPESAAEVEADIARRRQAYILSQNDALSSVLRSFPKLSVDKTFSGATTRITDANPSGAKYVAVSAGTVAFHVTGKGFVPIVKVTLVSASGEFREMVAKNPSGGQQIKFAVPVFQGQVLGITIEGPANYTGTGEYTIEAIAA